MGGVMLKNAYEKTLIELAASGTLTDQQHKALAWAIGELEKPSPDQQRLDWCDRHSGSWDIVYANYYDSWDGENPPSVRAVIDAAAGKDAIKWNGGA